MHAGRVDIVQALKAMGPLYRMHAFSRLHPNAPALTGGVLDAWPAAFVKGSEIARQEEAAVRAWELSEA